MSTVTIFKKPDDYELLEHMNTVQNAIILDLQKKNSELEQKVQHLEQILLHSANVIELKND